MLSKNLSNIFSEQCNYKNINKIGKTQLRDIKNGIQLRDAIYYEFRYTKLNKTKEDIVSSINYKNNTKFTRQAFESKINNIPVELYSNLFYNLCNLYNSNYNSGINCKLIGIDGSYNNDKSVNEHLNLGFFDITNGVPIDIKLYGKEDKNKELKYAKNYITQNIDKFRGNIIVCDRLYFSYDFIQFLITNDLKFIIRVKGQGVNLDPNSVPKKYLRQRELITNIKNNTRLIKYKNAIKKTIYNTNSKKKNNVKTELEIINDCIIVTNIMDKTNYNDKTIMDLYRSRWDIEVFFKYIKHNFKFQHMPSNLDSKFNKMYFCELIITYLVKILEKDYIQRHNIQMKKENKRITINQTQLTKGIYKKVIYKALDNTLNEEELDKFTKSYTKIIINKSNRSFPRTSKTPFSKWYIKGYYIHTKYVSVTDAIVNGEIDKLNKNLKLIANKILSINGKKYG